MNRIQFLREDKRKVALELFDGVCFGCLKKFSKGFSFHHRDYTEEEERILKTLDPYNWWMYVKPTIYSNPERFFVLCGGCHSVIDRIKNGLSRIPRWKLTRLLLVTYMTELKIRKKK